MRRPAASRCRRSCLRAPAAPSRRRPQTERRRAAHAGGEASLVLPDLSTVDFRGINGRTLLMGGLVVCALGLLFGLMTFTQLKNLPVHASMLEVSELIYETCKTYLITQGKFILLLEVFIGVIMVFYFGVLRAASSRSRVVDHPALQPDRHRRQLRRRLVRHPRQHLRQLAHRVRQPARQAVPDLRHPAQGRHEHRHAAHQRRAAADALHPAVHSRATTPAPCFIGFAIGESLGAAALRIAGGIFTKIADIGSDLMKIVFNIKEDDARNPGVIADCTGDNAGDSVGPSADGFETYGVTGVALISFILLAVHDARVQVQLLVWIFVMRIMMIVASGLSYFINEAVAKARYGNVDKMNFEAPLTSLVWLTSIVSVVLTYVVSYLLIPDLGDGTLWWKLSTIITCGTLAGAIIPELVKVFTSTESAPRQGSRHLVARRRRVAEHPVRPRRRQLQRLLARPEHRGADGHRVSASALLRPRRR